MSKLSDSTLDWLLEPDNPPVRYLTLLHLLGRTPSDPEVEQAKARLPEYEPTRAILAQFDQFRNHDGHRSYQKYGGKYWQVIFLGNFHADGRDPRIREVVEKLIETRDWVLIPQGGQCLTANLLSALTMLGYGDHPIVLGGITGLAERLVSDGGIDCEVMLYSLLPFCFMAQPKLLLCFSQNAGLKRQPAVRAAIDLLSANLIDHQISMYVPGNRKEWLEVIENKPALPAGQTVKGWIKDRKKQFLAEKGTGQPDEKAGWLKFGFPLHYNSDLLEAMYALALCGTPMSDRLLRALQIVREKMTNDGRWILENTLNGKMRADVEKRGKPSKWLTYRARYVLQHFEA
ncbi:MAG: hypothetical protein EHM61_11340 [Acidobacteria bacterium]|nr:MAG: hypothetical protein EHM61_11340 [Acidobacteriota bacterium]